jgi:hypothetical protein
MPFIGNQPALSYTSFAKQDFTTSATTSYVLDNPVANANELALFINFVRQEPTTAYSASGTSLTLTSATSATDDMYCVYLGKAVQTVNPPNNSVNEAQLNYPLTTFSSTGIDDNASSNALTIDSSSNLQFNSGYGSVATAYGCRAWVNFNGTGVVAIRDDGNVTSITDEGTGDYTVNFTTAMPDVNYSLVGTCTGGTSGQIINIRTASLSADPPTTMSTTAVRIRNRNDASTINDPNVVCIGVFR